MKCVPPVGDERRGHRRGVHHRELNLFQIGLAVAVVKVSAVVVSEYFAPFCAASTTEFLNLEETSLLRVLEAVAHDDTAPFE